MDEHRRFEELLGSYVLGELDHEEKQELERHLEGCSTCRDELEKIARGHRVLGEASIPPPPELKDRVVGNLPRRSARIPWMSAMAAAAVLLIALIAGALYAEVFRSQETVMASLAPTELATGASGEVRLEDSRPNTQVKLDVSGLPRLRADEYYELWFVQENGKRISAGGFTVDSKGGATVTMNAPRVADQYQDIGITLETSPGDPRPSPDKVLGGELQQV